MKNRSLNMLITALCLLGILSVILAVFIQHAHDEFEENITVSAEGVTEKILPVRDLKLNPTESKEYSVNLVCAASGLYDICLDYEELEDGGMKPFVNVTVKANNEIVYEGGLAALLNGDEVIQFEGSLYATKPLVISVCYLMPYEIGNEAQGTHANFDVHLKIQKR